MGYELDVVHVAVEKKLKKTGWRYIHHPPMSYNGSKKADFLAYDSINQYAYIIECKRNCEMLGEATGQVLLYKYLLIGENNPKFCVAFKEKLRPDERCGEVMKECRSAKYRVPVIVVPKFSTMEGDKEFCQEVGILLITVDTPQFAQLPLFDIANKKP